MAVATIVAPYNPLTSWVSSFLHDVAPETFLGNEPQRVIILGLAEGGTIGRDNVLMGKVAEDSKRSRGLKGSRTEALVDSR
jgi:hypothetical protein